MRIKSWITASTLATAIALAFVPHAQAGTARLLLESDVNMGAGAEFSQSSYASVADLIANSPSSSHFLPTDFANIYSVGDIAYDNGAYRFLIESNFDLPVGRELFILTYDSWADVLTNSFSSTSLTLALPLDLDPLTSVRGFTYDGDAYRILTQRTGDLSITSYATFADLLANHASDVVPLAFYVPGLAYVGGLAFDNGVYRLLLEGNVATPDADLVLLSYASFDDLVANNRASRRDLSQNIAAGYAVHGFEFEPSVMGPGSGVPEPTTWAMLILGFGLIGGAQRRRRAREGASSTLADPGLFLGRLQAFRATRAFIRPAVVTAIALALAPTAQAGTARLLLESDANMAAGFEFEQRSYGSVADLITNNAAFHQFLPLDISSTYSAADFAYDNGAYIFLIESDREISTFGAPELGLAIYGNWADVLSNTFSASGPLFYDVPAGYDIHGFTYDGSAYRVLLESNLVGASNLTLVSYASLDDFVANRDRVSQRLRLDLADGISVAGLGFDNGVYRLLMESDIDTGGGSELSLFSYATFGNFLSNFQDSSQVLPQDIAAAYSVHGFEFEPSVVGPGPGVPEPTTWAMLILGFGLTGATMRRRAGRSPG